jgi:DNA replicative helicase MCM subunit Mcm2 (Cdc46/Mcm family)
MTKNHKLTATNPHINVLSHITQFELKCLMGKSDMNNGLANRFLWACVRRTKKLAFPLPMNDDKVKVLAEKLADAIKEAKGEGEITLSTDARAYWDVKYHEVSQDEQGILGAITSRSEAYVMRVSLLFCLLDCTPQIEQRHIEAACHLVEFCNKSAQFIFTTPAECEAGTDADKLLNALAEKSLNQTAISKLFSGHKKRPELMTLLNELQSMNKIKKLPQLAGSKTVMWAKV